MVCPECGNDEVYYELVDGFLEWECKWCGFLVYRAKVIREDGNSGSVSK